MCKYDYIYNIYEVDDEYFPEDDDLLDFYWQEVVLTEYNTIASDF